MAVDHRHLCDGICGVCESLIGKKKNVAPVSHGKISERQRNFPCSEAEGNNGQLDQRS